ncbi:MAG: hypothetical protein JWQ84_2825 [Mucilaginibacter sp.]|jgi:hypothetical protein|nr:hypothetical protein [Mucilaginibacter sp.]MDB5140864.1 hypothetical protein [Mucilaginibacter sp.]
MANEKSSKEISPSTEVYKTNRGQIEHYDNAINQRVIWLSIGQSFFFNVYAMLVTGKAPTPDLMSKQKMLAVIFPFAALLTAVFTFFDVVATLVYLRKLRRYYERATESRESDKLYPPVYGRPIDRIFQHISPVLIPLVFIITWVYLLFYDHHLI